MLGEGLAGFREKEMIFPMAAPFSQLLFIGTVLINVIIEIAQTVLPQRQASLLRSLAHHGDHAMFAIKIAQAQISQFRDANASIIEQPER